MDKKTLIKLIQWINQNKALLLSIALIFALLIVRLYPANPGGVNTPVQKQEQKVEIKNKKDENKKVHKKLSTSTDTTVKTIVKEYDKKTGVLVKETKTEVTNKKKASSAVDKEKKVKEKVVEKKEDTKDYSQPYTGVTAGAIVLPSGGGITAGVTVLELPPLTLSAQAAYVAVPQGGLAAGVSINGTIAPRLEAGLGVYIGPQTAIGYNPIPGAPFTVQPGVLIQYRF